jgi:sulfate transport system substrate-binding protein
MNFKQITATVLASIAPTATQIASSQTLLNASYDVSREFYKDYNAAVVAVK